MEALEADYKSGLFHHAYLLPYDQKVNEDLIKFIENTLKLKYRGNPDVIVLMEESFTVELARRLKEMESLSPSKGDKKVFVVSFNFITREAQNALLKVLEEPNEGTYFFLMTAFPDKLLPTLRSRLRIVDETSEANEKIKEFISSSVPERLKLIKGIVEDKDRARAIFFLNSLEGELYKSYKKGVIKDTSIFQSIRDARSYMGDRAPSVKMLMENISLSIPVLR
ncbi:MAG: hypothetical protein QF858_00905 [Candidatus Pacebacteria bacterium]|jgi:DNA polymerase III delta prime subunit|nr:hypothetical protein [bacterium]MDP6527425.1 hypothetical protein [Candidatus Paceibacterota bacterium]MDP6659668.1 hypothetical protein [Candidatus Paceibacterota bacterium]|tara:strand:+ start:9018 stop:9689 length:672 start_codon:yes stop_codon:yes gene_type:complete